MGTAKSVVVLFALEGKQRRPRLRRKYCPRHYPSRDTLLPQGDLFLGCSELPCDCARNKASEYWLVEAPSNAKALEACKSWPMLVEGTRVIEHGKPR